MRTFGLVLATIAIIGGTCGLVVGTQTHTAAQTPLVQGCATIVVAGLALFGVMAGILTWSSSQRQTRAERTRDIYSQLVVLLVRQFLGVTSIQLEAELRANVSTWASPSVVRALGNWNATVDRVVSAQAPPEPDGRTVLTEDARRQITTSLAEVVNAIRTDLGAGPVAANEIEAAIFNDPTRDAGKAGQLES